MIAAPFLGEFGWEVALWAPHLRWLRQTHHQQGDFKVWCRPGHEALYEDFATKIEPVRTPRIRRVDCENAWDETGRVDYAELLNHLEHKRIAKARKITPGSMMVQWKPVPFTKRTNYKLLGDRAPKPGKVAVHIRCLPDKQPERNWPVMHAERVLGTLFERDLVEQVVSVGSIDGSSLFDSCRWTDQRGVRLRELIDELATCTLIIGPSSGPLHLANQCGVPAVWWSSNAKDEPRYARVWNPFSVGNVQAAKSWTPSVDQVVEAVERCHT